MKRYRYNLYHQNSTASEIGRLCPTCILEVAPGDTFSGKTGLLVRFSPLKRAMLTDFYVDQFFFYVPHRLVWDQWETFISNGPDTSDTVLPPFIDYTDDTAPKFLYINSSGLGTKGRVSTLRLRAYNLIFNEFFRDDFQNPLTNEEVNNNIFGQPVSYKKDYWSAMQAQRGYIEQHQVPVISNEVSATGIIEAVRRQKAAQRRATYGTRYIDILRGYGIRVNYQMLQRPELVATSRSTVNVTDVVNSSGATGSTLGTLAGHGLSGGRLRFKRKSFPEHGTLMGFVVVRPRNTDTDFIEWFDRQREYEDYYDPMLVGLPPKQIDVADTVTVSNSTGVVGFQPHYRWYRMALSRSHPQLDDEWIANSVKAQNLDDHQDYKLINPRNFDSLFDLASLQYGHFQISAVNALNALRMIPPETASVMGG